MGVEAVLMVVLGISVASLAVAWVLARQVLSADTGKPEMQEIAAAIREGAEAFLSRQYRTIGMLSAVAAAAIFAFYYLNRHVPNIAQMGEGTAWKVTLSFITGAACSAIAGYIGMFVSIRANLRTAAAAMTSLNKALQLAVRGGAVSGLTVVAMSLLGVGGLFVAFGGRTDYEHVPLQIVGFGFGASFVAGSTRRPRTWARTWSARWRRASPRTTPATPRSSPTWWATTSATAPAAAPTSSSPRRPRTSVP